MASPRVDLHVAGFVASPGAKALGIAPNVLRRCTVLLVETAIDDAGAEPRLLDGDGLAEVIRLLARKVGPKDDEARALPRVIEAYFRHVLDTEMVPNAFELERALGEQVPQFAALVAAPGERIGGRVDPIRNRADKVGRNDPCPCGSGKKFKQCCAKLG